MYASDRQPLVAANIRADKEVDEVFDAIIHGFTDAQRDLLMDRLVGRIQGWRISERRQYPEKFPERNAEIRQRHRDGMSYQQLSLQPYGLTKSGIAKVCKRGGKSVDT
jgi:hypothetical protein